MAITHCQDDRDLHESIVNQIQFAFGERWVRALYQVIEIRRMQEASRFWRLGVG